MSKSRRDSGTLDEDFAARVAQLVLEGLADLREPQQYLDVAGKARQLGTSTDFVRQNAQRLGGFALPTNGSRTLWRFPVDVPSAPSGSGEPNGRVRERARASRRPRGELLPIRGRAA